MSEGTVPPKAGPYPIIVGVTGHRAIAAAGRPALLATVGALLGALKAHFGDALYLMTALADGAERLVTDVAEERGIKTIVVAPLPRERDRASLAEPERFKASWTRASLTLELPIVDPAAPDGDTLQLEQYGALLARRSHLLLALWDGHTEADATERGGPAHIVRMRREGEQDVAGFRASPLFAGAYSRLDLSPGGPVIRIATPREGDADDAGAAGTCYLLPGSENARTAAGETQIEPASVVAALDARVLSDLEQIRALNEQMAHFNAVDATLFRRQYGYLEPPKTKDGVPTISDPTDVAGKHLRTLRRLQAGADAAAQRFQRRLLGQWVPFESRERTVKTAKDWWKHFRRPLRLGVLFYFVAAVPTAVLGFEIYDHLGYPFWALLLYVVPPVASLIYYRTRVKREQWQNRFQDYRALAEAMRVQLFWALSAHPAAVCDNYLRKQTGELGWIQFALRGPALWATALALDLGTPQRELVTTCWLKDQCEFFVGNETKTGKDSLNERAARRGEALAQFFLYVGFFFSAAILAAEFGRRVAAAFHVGGVEHAFAGFEEVRHWVLIAAVSAPAFAAFFTISVNLRAYKAHARSYALMGRIFRRALDQLDPSRAQAPSDDEFRALIHELGRESLSENAEWLLDHRQRPIEQQN